MSQVNRKSITRSAGKSPSITKLAIRLEKAEAVFKAIPSTQEKRWTRALDSSCRIADRIVQAQAKTVDEMLLKLNIALSHPDGSITRGPKHHAIVSLREDLERLKAS
jgi:hypothetical protein